jgi:hypothetical protein
MRVRRPRRRRHRERVTSGRNQQIAGLGCRNEHRVARSTADHSGARRPLSVAATAGARMGMRAGGGRRVQWPYGKRSDS